MQSKEQNFIKFKCHEDTSTYQQKDVRHLGPDDNWDLYAKIVN